MVAAPCNMLSQPKTWSLAIIREASLPEVPPADNSAADVSDKEKVQQQTWSKMGVCFCFLAYKKL